MNYPVYPRHTRSLREILKSVDYRQVEVENQDRRSFRAYGITPPGTGSQAIVWNYGLGKVELVSGDDLHWQVKGIT